MASRRFGRARSVGLIRSVWTVLMTIYGCVWVVSDGHAHAWSIVATIATVVLGVAIGYRRRLGSVVLAPLGLWAAAALPVYVSSLWHRPFLTGVVRGFFDITVGGAVLSVSLSFLLALIAFPVRVLTPSRRRPDVEIFGPNESAAS